MIFSVTKNRQPLDPSLYNWDERTRTFYTNEHDLVLDFSGIDRVTFKTGWNCTFKTGSYCTFNTGFYCIFYIGYEEIKSKEQIEKERLQKSFEFSEEEFEI